MSGPEKEVKAYLKNKCETRGWSCLALEYPYKPGWPDRTIFMLNGSVAFIECKSSKTRHKKGHIDDQKACMRWLHTQGLFAGFAVDKSGVDTIIDMLGLGGTRWATGASTFDDI